jgi:hypothetical protein
MAIGAACRSESGSCAHKDAASMRKIIFRMISDANAFNRRDAENRPA